LINFSKNLSDSDTCSVLTGPKKFPSVLIWIHRGHPVTAESATARRRIPLAARRQEDRTARAKS
jgi:hypothetical protein